MKRPDVIILGAGAAGLAAARILSDKGLSILLLEARNRIGGRIHTIEDPAFGAPVELGAEFIHGRPKVTFDLLKQAGQITYDLPFDHRQRRGGHLSHLEDFSDELNKVMGGLAHLGKRDISFAQYLRNRRLPPSLNDAKRFAINFVQGFDAADPERISAKSLAEEQAGIGDVGEQLQFRPLRGYGALMEYLLGELHSKRVQIRLQTKVSEIRWRRGVVEIRAAGPNGPEAFHSPRVLVTLPLGILQIPPESPDSIRFTPDLPEKGHAATQLGSGPIVKAVLKFSQAFWEQKSTAAKARSDAQLRDAVFMHHPKAAFPTWWTWRPLHLTVLTAWAGGPKARALSGLSEAAIKSAAIKSLADLLGQRASKLASMLEGFHFYDWGSDRLAHGAYSYVTVGGSKARAALAKPIEQTLFFAGEATDTSGQASTVAGALLTGQRAANELTNTL